MMRMEHHQTQALKQTQQLVLNQKMQQALQILQMSGLELEQYVQQEMETNPFLEIIEKRDEPPVTSDNGADGGAVVSDAFDLDGFADSWGIHHQEGRDLSINRDLDAKRDYYEDSITKDESLRAHLLSQMRIVAPDDTLYAIGERIIIGDIDTKGYFTGDCDEIAQELECSPEQVEEALHLIQRFEPTGVGACNMTECLLIQIDVEYPGNDALRTLVIDHFDDLMRRQIPKIAKAMRIKPEDVEELKELLSTLNPWPGHEYLSEPTQYVAADVVVEKLDDEYIVRLTNERIPEIRLNKDYQQAMRAKSQNDDAKTFVREKVEAINLLRRNIGQRQQTLLKVAQSIVDVQYDFLEKGVEAIRPLTLQNIADRIGVHESTVARTTRGKYMQTPQGLFELKYFFSPGLARDTGDSQSSKSVQALVKKMIEDEGKGKPLSDQKIADMIKKQHGITVARRTVTKYREAMGMMKASMRKQYE